MVYRKLTALEITNLNDDGTVEFYVEVDSSGQVHREVGVDAVGLVLHRWSDEEWTSRRGLFDNTLFPEGFGASVDRELFEWFWARPKATKR